MLTNSLTLAEIKNPDDDLFLPWLDLFETSMPASEKMLVSYFLRLLKDKKEGMARLEYLFAALDQNNEFLGLTHYQLVDDKKLAWLWYIAIVPALRNKGWGGKLYQAVVSKVNTSRALFFEVEIPEIQDGIDKSEIARRRMEFYRRQGARLLRGIHYMQHVGPHQEPIPMHIMVHTFQPANEQVIFDWAKVIFQDDLTQIDALSLF